MLIFEVEKGIPQRAYNMYNVKVNSSEQSDITAELFCLPSFRDEKTQICPSNSIENKLV
jgi:folate-dependent tRNA-U54 methylase TrmFO/GidA